jgi:hypothetical protein
MLKSDPSLVGVVEVSAYIIVYSTPFSDLHTEDVLRCKYQGILLLKITY